MHNEVFMLCGIRATPLLSVCFYVSMFGHISFPQQIYVESFSYSAAWLQIFRSEECVDLGE